MEQSDLDKSIGRMSFLILSFLTDQNRPNGEQLLQKSF